MTNEELKKLIEKYDKEVNRLFKENKELKSKIDKAIEYINNYMPNYDFDHYNLEKLLKILKGE
jgi:DNA repair ATPase RecN